MYVCNADLSKHENYGIGSAEIEIVDANGTYVVIYLEQAFNVPKYKQCLTDISTVLLIKDFSHKSISLLLLYMFAMQIFRNKKFMALVQRRSR